MLNRPHWQNLYARIFYKTNTKQEENQKFCHRYGNVAPNQNMSAGNDQSVKSMGITLGNVSIAIQLPQIKLQIHICQNPP